ncbi:hypothetical protein [Pseudooceanicola aestuarii]|uniref:hypothetical protein n=1 Tax=Pseudooceanicola aestuarii TaxID=2697319 RepID=UPI0013D42B7A|nr:hypothetical protein [Pseudooceanicola aestuarii]
MASVRRFTTFYVETEDRVRLSVEMSDDQVRVLWLTRRLLNRLVPSLLKRLTAQAALDPAPAPRAQAQAAQRFTQAAAVGAIRPQKGVTTGPGSGAAGPAGFSALAHGVRVRPAETGRALALDFTGPAETDRAAESAPAPAPLVTLTLREAALRQWLGVLHGQYGKAGWAEPFWPAWIDPEAPLADLRLN